MKISYNWLSQYIQTTRSVEEIADVLTAIGLEVEGVEKVEAIPGGLKGVVVGEVVECGKHPDADRLSLTKVFLGEGDPVQIVCGAPNVAQGQKVLVATVGTTLYPSSGEPLTIKKGKIRGQESHGMICAEDELGLGTSHAGIMVLDASAAPGTPAATYLQIKADYCIEIGLTPNRTDAFSHFGVARDLAAALRNMEGIASEEVHVTLPSPALPEMRERQPIEIIIENSEACPRYAGYVIEGIQVGPSPEWLQQYLATIGLRPINNIVDITNFVQHEIGQPLHAFDADKIKGNKVVVRLAKQDEKMITLDGIERTLHDQDLMICNASEPMCIAGVFGGQDSGVTESTKRVFIESAYFNPVFVRKTSKRHALKTDASFRFERGADPTIVPWALQRAAQLVIEIAGGTPAGNMTDVYPTEIVAAEVSLTYSGIARLIGKAIPADKVKSILTSLDIHIISEESDTLKLRIPHYRTDVTREADVVEEILRIYGFNNIDIPTRMVSSTSIPAAVDPEKWQAKISDMLSSYGFNEIMGMSLTREKYVGKEGLSEMSADAAVRILNPLSSDLGIMRTSLLFSGMETIALNQNHRQPDVRLYEFGKVFSKHANGYSEEKRLSVFVSGQRHPESWNHASASVAFTDLKAAWERIVRAMGIAAVTYQNLDEVPFDGALECKSGKHVIARLGRVSDVVLKEMDVKNEVWYADIRWETLLKLIPAQRVSYREPDKFPAVRRDLSLLIDQGVQFADIEKCAFESERKLLRGVNLFDVYEGKNLEAGKKSYAVSFTLQDSSKTMTDQQVEASMGRILKTLQEKLGASLRG